MKTSAAIPALIAELKRRGFSGDLRADPVTRQLYATDASIYRIEPLGVAFPRHVDELNLALEVCAAFGVPTLARGSGSSLAGQAIGPALILDCSRHLDNILEIQPEAGLAIVEPGVVLQRLNKALAAYGLQFGPDPASAERATLGGSLANNAAGAHSILYGMAADHLLAAEVALADGSQAFWEELSLGEAQRRAGIGQQADLLAECERLLQSPEVSLEQRVYGAVLAIRIANKGDIQRHWPKTYRRASGYSLNYLLPWSPVAPPAWPAAQPYPPVGQGRLNLAPLLAGSEGTLAVMRRLWLRLTPLPAATLLVVLAYPSVAEACDRVPEVLERRPSAVELIPPSLVRLARSVPAYAAQLDFLDGLRQPDGELPALLVVEFSGEKLEALLPTARDLANWAPSLIAAEAADQRRVWNVRKVGLGLFMSRPGHTKPWSFIEDLAVPVERLGEFVRGMERLLQDFGTTAEVYGHASAGCLHFRPLLDLTTLSGVRDLRMIAQQAVELTLSLGGAVSGEHGDGLARSEWLERMYGSEIISAFRRLKVAADPQGLLNPGKIVALSPDAPLPRMDENLRFGPAYRVRLWPTALDFTARGGLDGAIEQCNGAGVCRKEDGVMCPSFQATREEMHSTRGRANLLRLLISGGLPAGLAGEQAVFQALELCLACKGCLSECPSAVDMARLKYEFLHHYYRRRPRPLSDYLFGFLGQAAPWLQPFGPLINHLLAQGWVKRLNARVLDLAPERSFPRFAPHSLPALIRRLPLTSGKGPWVLFLSDPFTDHFYPEVGLRALELLRRLGYRVHYLPVSGAGRPLLSKGFLGAARRHAERVVRAIQAADPQGRYPVVGVEPSEIYTLADEYPDLVRQEVLSREGLLELAGRAWSMEELLLRWVRGVAAGAERYETAEMRIAILSPQMPPKDSSLSPKPQVLLHGHCYQKARPPAADGLPVGVQATAALLTACGYPVQLVEAGCCGMAGAFGYEDRHYPLSMQIGELKLFPALRQTNSDTIIAASGISCQSQILDGVGRPAIHPLLLL